MQESYGKNDMSQIDKEIDCLLKAQLKYGCLNEYVLFETILEIKDAGYSTVRTGYLLEQYNAFVDRLKERKSDLYLNNKSDQYQKANISAMKGVASCLSRHTSVLCEHEEETSDRKRYILPETEHIIQLQTRFPDYMHEEYRRVSVRLADVFSKNNKRSRKIAYKSAAAFISRIIDECDTARKAKKENGGDAKISKPKISSWLVENHSDLFKDGDYELINSAFKTLTDGNNYNLIKYKSGKCIVLVKQHSMLKCLLGYMEQVNLVE